MGPTERALQALRTQLQFERTQAGAALAQARRQCAQTQADSAAQRQRCDAATQEWRAAMARSPLNPALLDLLRRLLAGESQAWRGSLERLAAAQHQESLAHAALSALHQRTQAIERALRAETRQRLQRQQALEIMRQDEMWLQRLPRAAA